MGIEIVYMGVVIEVRTASQLCHSRFNPRN
jgi:hypothetical protein